MDNSEEIKHCCRNCGFLGIRSHHRSQEHGPNPLNPIRTDAIRFITDSVGPTLTDAGKETLRPFTLECHRNCEPICLARFSQYGEIFHGATAPETGLSLSRSGGGVQVKREIGYRLLGERSHTMDKLDRDRDVSCFFFPRVAGMSFDTATLLEQQASIRREAEKDRKLMQGTLEQAKQSLRHSRNALCVSVIALLASVILSILGSLNPTELKWPDNPLVVKPQQIKTDSPPPASDQPPVAMAGTMAKETPARPNHPAAVASQPVDIPQPGQTPGR